MPSILDRRLLVLTGKGGTGKSTLAAALGLCAARQGKRVLICEVTARERVTELLGTPAAGTQLREAAPRLWTVHVQPREALREYALMTLKLQALYDLVFEGRVVRYFLGAAPSLSEIVMLGKVWWHAVREQERGRPRWDLVILDAPATGHGLTFLTVPSVFLKLVDEGPLARDLREMQALLQDPLRSSVNLTTLPEEMPINEAIELHGALTRAGLPQGAVFFNGFVASRFSNAERSALRSCGPQLGAAAEALEAHEERAALSRHHAEELREKIALPIIPVPLVTDVPFGRASVETLSRKLEAAMLAPARGAP